MIWWSVGYLNSVVWPREINGTYSQATTYALVLRYEVPLNCRVHGVTLLVASKGTAWRGNGEIVGQMAVKDRGVANSDRCLALHIFPITSRIR